MKKTTAIIIALVVLGGVGRGYALSNGGGDGVPPDPRMGQQQPEFNQERRLKAFLESAISANDFEKAWLCGYHDEYGSRSRIWKADIRYTAFSYNPGDSRASHLQLEVTCDSRTAFVISLTGENLSTFRENHFDLYQGKIVDLDMIAFYRGDPRAVAEKSLITTALIGAFQDALEAYGVRMAEAGRDEELRKRLDHGNAMSEHFKSEIDRLSVLK